MKKLWLGSLVLGSLLAQEQMDIPEAKMLDNKLDKNGVLVGVDLGFGFGGGGRSSAVADLNNNLVRVVNFDTSIKSFNAGKLFVGYQKYSEDVRQIGLNVKAALGVGGYELRHAMVSDRTNWGENPTDGQTIVENFVPLSVGIEANFLYDFYEEGKSVVGLNLGLGYEFVHTFNTGVKFDSRLNEPFLSMYGGLFDKREMNYFLLTPKVGLHYYYDRHQIGIDVRFSKVLNIDAPTVKRVKTEAYDGQSMFRAELSDFLAFGLNYAYRF